MSAFTPILQIAAFALLGITLALFVYRVIRGPHVLDRAMCVEGIAMTIICVMAVWNITLNSGFFFDVILVLSIVGFISSVIIAKYLEVGDIID